MDPPRFDALTRSLAAPRSRRRLVRTFSAGLLTAMGSGERRQAAARVCRIAGERCDERNTCCGGLCCRNDYEVCCDGACTDIAYDDRHCGACTQEWPAGLGCCGSRCRGLSDDDHRCDGCNHDCATMGGTCENGRCSYPPEYVCGSANRCGQPPDTPCCVDGVCLGRAEDCEPNGTACCATDCTFDRKWNRHVCLSQRDGPCLRDDDCAACFFSEATCKGICQGGQCAR